MERERVETGTPTPDEKPGTQLVTAGDENVDQFGIGRRESSCGGGSPFAGTTRRRGVAQKEMPGEHDALSGLEFILPEFEGRSGSPSEPDYGFPRVIWACVAQAISRAAWSLVS